MAPNMRAADVAPPLLQRNIKVFNRWKTLLAGIYVMLCAGPVFAYGSIGGQIQEILGCGESEKQMIGVLGNIGLWTNVVGGLSFDRFGARPTMIAGAMLQLIGFGGMYFSLTNLWPPVVVGLFWFLVGHGSGLIYISTLFANCKNFAPSERGSTVGTMACFFGCSSTVLLSILDGCLGGRLVEGSCSHGFMGSDVKTFMAFLAIVLPSVVVVCSLNTEHGEGIHEAPSDQADKRFTGMLAGVVLLVLFICFTNIIAIEGSKSIRTWGNYVVLVLLAALSLVTIRPAADLCVTGASGRDSAPITENVPPVSATSTVRFWLLWLTFGLTVGGDIGTLNFMSSIVNSQGGTMDITHLCVVVAMTCDSIARFLSGYIISKGVPPTLLFAAGPLLLSVSQFTMLISSTLPLLAACGVLGISDGIMWSTGPLLTGKFFGLKSAGKNFGFVVIAAAIFVLALSSGLEPLVYDAHDSSTKTACTGGYCFVITHLVAAVAGMLGTGIALFIHMRFGTSF